VNFLLSALKGGRVDTRREALVALCELGVGVEASFLAGPAIEMLGDLPNQYQEIVRGYCSRMGIEMKAGVGGVTDHSHDEDIPYAALPEILRACVSENEWRSLNGDEQASLCDIAGGADFAVAEGEEVVLRRPVELELKAIIGWENCRADAGKECKLEPTAYGEVFSGRTKALVFEGLSMLGLKPGTALAGGSKYPEASAGMDVVGRNLTSGVLMSPML
jgi:hypothetical protein